MPIEKPNYERWKRWPMTAAQRADAADLRSLFHAALLAMEFQPETARNITVEFQRASVVLTPRERKDGAYHRLRGGVPFMRLKIAVVDETPETRTAIHALINNLRFDKWIRVNPFAVEFDTRENLSGQTFDHLFAAVLPRSPLGLRARDANPGELTAALRRVYLRPVPKP